MEHDSLAIFFFNLRELMSERVTKKRFIQMLFSRKKVGRIVFVKYSFSRRKIEKGTLIHLKNREIFNVFLSLKIKKVQIVPSEVGG